MNEKGKCTLIPKYNSYRHLTKNGCYIDCSFKSHEYIHQLEEKIDEVLELVKDIDWRLDDVHDLIDGYSEIEKILR